MNRIISRTLLGMSLLLLATNVSAQTVVWTEDLNVTVQDVVVFEVNTPLISPHLVLSWRDSIPRTGNVVVDNARHNDFLRALDYYKVEMGTVSGSPLEFTNHKTYFSRSYYNFRVDLDQTRNPDAPNRGQQVHYRITPIFDDGSSYVGEPRIIQMFVPPVATASIRDLPAVPGDTDGEKSNHAIIGSSISLFGSGDVRGSSTSSHGYEWTVVSTEPEIYALNFRLTETQSPTARLEIRNGVPVGTRAIIQLKYTGGHTFIKSIFAPGEDTPDLVAPVSLNGYDRITITAGTVESLIPAPVASIAQRLLGGHSFAVDENYPDDLEVGSVFTLSGSPSNYADSTVSMTYRWAVSTPDVTLVPVLASSLAELITHYEEGPITITLTVSVGDGDTYPLRTATTTRVFNIYNRSIIVGEKLLRRDINYNPPRVVLDWVPPTSRGPGYNGMVTLSRQQIGGGGFRNTVTLTLAESRFPFTDVGNAFGELLTGGGIYVYRYRVVNRHLDNNNEFRDGVTVTFQIPSPPTASIDNLPPIPGDTSGQHLNHVLLEDEVTLRGRGSYNDPGVAITYAWSRVSADPPDSANEWLFTNSRMATQSVTAPNRASTAVFQMTMLVGANDPGYTTRTTTADITLTATSPATFGLPIAEIADFETSPFGQTVIFTNQIRTSSNVTLDGTASSYAQTGVLNYHWEILSHGTNPAGGAAPVWVLSNANSATPQLRVATAESVATIRLTVSVVNAGVTLSHSDTITLRSYIAQFPAGHKLDAYLISANPPHVELRWTPPTRVGANYNGMVTLARREVPSSVGEAVSVTLSESDFPITESTTQPSYFSTPVEFGKVYSYEYLIRNYFGVAARLSELIGIDDSVTAVIADLPPPAGVANPETFHNIILKNIGASKLVTLDGSGSFYLDRTANLTYTWRVLSADPPETKDSWRLSNALVAMPDLLTPTVESTAVIQLGVETTEYPFFATRADRTNITVRAIDRVTLTGGAIPIRVLSYEPPAVRIDWTPPTAGTSSFDGMVTLTRSLRPLDGGNQITETVTINATAFPLIDTIFPAQFPDLTHAEFIAPGNNRYSYEARIRNLLGEKIIAGVPAGNLIGAEVVIEDVSFSLSGNDYPNNVTLGSTVTLDGSNTLYERGVPVRYSWALLRARPPETMSLWTLSNSNVAMQPVTAPNVASTAVFQLTATVGNDAATPILTRSTTENITLNAFQAGVPSGDMLTASVTSITPPRVSLDWLAPNFLGFEWDFMVTLRRVSSDEAEADATVTLRPADFPLIDDGSVSGLPAMSEGNTYTYHHNTRNASGESQTTPVVVVFPGPPEAVIADVPTPIPGEDELNNFIHTNQNVTLDGTGSNYGDVNIPMTYHWVLLGASGVNGANLWTLTNANSPRPIVQAATGALTATFQLTVRVGGQNGYPVREATTNIRLLTAEAGMPSGFTFNARLIDFNPTTVQLDWTLPTFTGVGYDGMVTLTRTGTDGAAKTSVTLTADADDPSFQLRLLDIAGDTNHFASLAEGHTFTYMASFKNRIGTAFSESVSIPIFRPPPVRNLRVSRPTGNIIVFFQWDTPEISPTDSIPQDISITYRVERQVNDGEFELVAEDVTITGYVEFLSPEELNNFQPHNRYTYRVLPIYQRDGGEARMGQSADVQVDYPEIRIQVEPFGSRFHNSYSQNSYVRSNFRVNINVGNTRADPSGATHLTYAWSHISGRRVRVQYFAHSSCRSNCNTPTDVTVIPHDEENDAFTGTSVVRLRVTETNPNPIFPATAVVQDITINYVAQGTGPRFPRFGDVLSARLIGHEPPIVELNWLYPSTPGFGYDERVTLRRALLDDNGVPVSSENVMLPVRPLSLLDAAGPTHNPALFSQQVRGKTYSYTAEYNNAHSRSIRPDGVLGPRDVDNTLMLPAVRNLNAQVEVTTYSVADNLQMTWNEPDIRNLTLVGYDVERGVRGSTTFNPPIRVAANVTRFDQQATEANGILPICGGGAECEGDATVYIYRIKPVFSIAPVAGMESFFEIGADGLTRGPARTVMLRYPPEIAFGSTPFPIDLNASVNGGTLLSLDWQPEGASATNLQGYRVYRSVNGGDFIFRNAVTLIPSGQPQMYTYLEPLADNILADNVYVYRVLAHFASGELSQPTDVKMVNPLLTTQFSVSSTINEVVVSDMVIAGGSFQPDNASSVTDDLPMTYQWRQIGSSVVTLTADGFGNFEPVFQTELPTGVDTASVELRLTTTVASTTTNIFGTQTATHDVTLTVVRGGAPAGHLVDTRITRYDPPRVSIIWTAPSFTGFGYGDMVTIHRAEFDDVTLADTLESITLALSDVTLGVVDGDANWNGTGDGAQFVTPLVDGKNYVYSATVMNAFGDATTAIVPINLPLIQPTVGAITLRTEQTSGGNMLVLDWDAPPASNVPFITHYRIERAAGDVNADPTFHYDVLPPSENAEIPTEYSELVATALQANTIYMYHITPVTEFPFSTEEYGESRLLFFSTQALPTADIATVTNLIDGVDFPNTINAGATITVDGNASSYTTNDTMTYSWRQVGGDNSQWTLSDDDQAAAQVAVASGYVGTAEFELTVTVTAQTSYLSGNRPTVTDLTFTDSQRITLTSLLPGIPRGQNLAVQVADYNAPSVQINWTAADFTGFQYDGMVTLHRTSGDDTESITLAADTTFPVFDAAGVLRNPALFSVPTLPNTYSYTAEVNNAFGRHITAPPVLIILPVAPTAMIAQIATSLNGMTFQNRVEQGATVTLDGSNSRYDFPGVTMSYAWEKTSGSDLWTLSNDDQAFAQVTTTAADGDTAAFELTVTVGDGTNHQTRTATASVTLTAYVNGVPTGHLLRTRVIDYNLPSVELDWQRPTSVGLGYDGMVTLSRSPDLGFVRTVVLPDNTTFPILDTAGDLHNRALFPAPGISSRYLYSAVVRNANGETMTSRFAIIPAPPVANITAVDVTLAGVSYPNHISTAETLTLDGSASSYADSSVTMSYAWTQTDGDRDLWTLTNADQAFARVTTTAEEGDTAEFALMVRIDEHSMRTSTPVTITLTAYHPNAPSGGTLNVGSRNYALPEVGVFWERPTFTGLGYSETVTIRRTDSAGVSESITHTPTDSARFSIADTAGAQLDSAPFSAPTFPNVYTYTAEVRNAFGVHTVMGSVTLPDDPSAVIADVDVTLRGTSYLNRIATNVTVTLDGSGSSYDASGLPQSQLPITMSYSWAQTSGGDSLWTLTDDAQAMAQVATTAAQGDTAEFELTVTVTHGRATTRTNTATITLTAYAAGVPDGQVLSARVADYNAPSVELNWTPPTFTGFNYIEMVTLHRTGGAGDESVTLAVDTTFPITDTAASNYFTAPTFPNTYAYTAEVENAIGVDTTTPVTVILPAAPIAEIAPVVITISGAEYTNRIAVGSSVSLTGGGSYDDASVTMSYAWSLADGDSSLWTLANVDQAIAQVTALDGTASTAEFALTVTIDAHSMRTSTAATITLASYVDGSPSGQTFSVSADDASPPNVAMNWSPPTIAGLGYNGMVTLLRTDDAGNTVTAQPLEDSARTIADGDSSPFPTRPFEGHEYTYAAVVGNDIGDVTLSQSLTIPSTSISLTVAERTLQAPTITFSGSVSHASGTPLFYRWRYVSGLSDATPTTFDTPAVTLDVGHGDMRTAVFEFCARDAVAELSNRVCEMVTFTIQPQPLMASAAVIYFEAVGSGEKRKAVEGSVVTLDASASTGDIASVTWVSVSPDDIEITPIANTRKATFTVPNQLAADVMLTFRLTVMHTDGMTTDTAVTVSAAAGENDPPIAVASANHNAEEGATVKLDSSMSSDPEGEALTFFWEQIRHKNSGTGPGEKELPVTLSDPTAAMPTFVVPNTFDVKIYSFKLTVTDERGLSSSDTMTSP